MGSDLNPFHIARLYSMPQCCCYSDLKVKNAAKEKLCRPK